VVAAKTKNESLDNSESTDRICRFGAIIVGQSGGAGRRAPNGCARFRRSLPNLPSARQIAAELNRRGIKSATVIAEFERELIRERTGEGRKRAMQNGVRFGRKPKLSDFQRREALARRGNGETLAQIARSYAVSVSMISRL